MSDTADADPFFFLAAVWGDLPGFIRYGRVLSGQSLSLVLLSIEGMARIAGSHLTGARRGLSLTPTTGAVTLRGERSAVVLSVRDYDALRAGCPSLVDDLLSGPAWDDSFVEALEARAKVPSRDVAF